MVNDFLLEIGCEELPSGSVLPIAVELVAAMTSGLEKAGLHFTAVKHFATPRRIGCLIQNLDAQQPLQKLVKRGPSVQAAFDANGIPTKALTGFLNSTGLTLEALQTQSTEKGDFLVYESEIAGLKTPDLLPDLLQKALDSLTTYKPMRWASGDFLFARPVHWILMLFGSEIVPATVFGLQSGRLTYGHRFHHPEGLSLSHPDAYESALEKASVIADFSKRRDLILENVQSAAASMDAQAVMPEKLLEEVTSIVEYPQALIIPFEATFLSVPKEVLITAMQVHQKCFALESQAGKLLPWFITVANIKSLNPEQVIAGNAKVMHARLSDAAFFFEQDKKSSFENWIMATKKVIFQNRLGSLYDKAKRVEALSDLLAIAVDADRNKARRAAALSKADLMTGMVGEFPELQGLMGYYYALEKGEDSYLAQALVEQYLPRFSGDALPESRLGKILSLADRLDTLVGIYGIGLKPSGVKDPFKLRRHALALGRLLITIEAPLLLSTLIREAYRLYPANNLEMPEMELTEGLRHFIFERLLAFYQAQGISQDKVLATKACQSDCLQDFDKRLQALNQFVGTTEAIALSAACKRVGNILQRNNDKPAAVNEALLIEPAEQALYQALTAIERNRPLNAPYGLILESLATLRAPVDRFFDEVMVMVEDEKLKTNRLALLTQLQASLQSVADISLLIS